MFHPQSSRGRKNISALAEQDLKSKEEYFRSEQFVFFFLLKWRNSGRLSEVVLRGKLIVSVLSNIYIIEYYFFRRGIFQYK